MQGLSDLGTLLVSRVYIWNGRLSAASCGLNGDLADFDAGIDTLYSEPVDVPSENASSAFGSLAGTVPNTGDKTVRLVGYQPRL